MQLFYAIPRQGQDRFGGDVGIFLRSRLEGVKISIYRQKNGSRCTVHGTGRIKKVPKVGKDKKRCTGQG